MPAEGPEPAVEYERPLDFARVLVTGMHVTHTVQGWPAAFWRPVGRGRVVFTAVGAEAWIRRATVARPRWDPNRMTDFSPTRHLESLPLLQIRNPALGQPSLFRSYLSERIGYRIASRGPVSAVLGLFCAALLLSGVVFARWKRLEHLAWIAPGLALAAAVPLVGLGLRSQRAVPATVGEAQFIEVSDSADQLTANGMLAFYDPQSTGEATGAQAGGRFEFENAATAGTHAANGVDRHGLLAVGESPPHARACGRRRSIGPAICPSRWRFTGPFPPRVSRPTGPNPPCRSPTP